MKEFKWQAKNHLLQKQFGYIIAENKNVALKLLTNKNLKQVKISQNISLKTTLSIKQKCDLIWQLSLLLLAGIPLKKSLLILKENCSIKLIYLWLDYVLSKLDQGYTFSKAIIHKYAIFTQQDLGLIKIAELTGNLAYLMQMIAKNKMKQLELRQSIMQILMYPIIVLSIVLLLIICLLIFVVPQFSLIYANSKMHLPSLTIFLIYLSKLISEQYIFLLGALLVILYLLRIFNNRYHIITRIFNKIFAYTPGIKKIKQYVILIDLCNSLFLMLDSGVDLEKSLLLLQKDNDAYIKKHLNKMLQGINQGYNFSHCLSSELFPMQVQQMLAVAETSGNLKIMLQQIATNYNILLNQYISLLSKLIESCMMLIIGCVVSIILYALYKPIFNLGMIY